MELTRLALTDFRSYAAAELAPDPGLTVVAGPNGTGKTNLLEAIHATIAGRSHRAVVDAELVRHGAPFARVRLELAGGTAAGGSTIELVVPGREPTPGIRKRLTVNGVPRRSTTLSEVARVVLFRPEEMLLLVGSPSERRRFLDGIVAQRDRRARAGPRRRGSRRHPAQRPAACHPRRGGVDRHARLLGRAARRSSARGSCAARLEALASWSSGIGPLHDAVASDERGATRSALTYLDGLKEAWPERVRPAAPDAAPTTSWRPPIGAGSPRSARRRRGTASAWSGRSATTCARSSAGATWRATPAAASSGRSSWP